MLWQKLEIIVDQEPGNTWLKLKLCHLEVKKKKMRVPHSYSVLMYSGSYEIWSQAAEA